MNAIEALISLPRSQDEGIVALSELLAILLLPALFTDENLLALLALTAVELSLHHGITDATASSCVMLAAVLVGRFGRYEEGAAFGRLGRAIVDARGLSAYRAKAYLDFSLVNHWSRPLRTNRDILEQALDWARAEGNFAVASYALNNLVSLSLSLGTPLAEVQRQCEEALPFVRRARYPMVEEVLTSQLRLVLNLRGLTAHFSTFDGEGFDERHFVSGLEANPQANSVAICWHFIRKLQARFLSGDYEAAYAASLQARRLLWTSRAFMEIPEYHLFTALTVAALHEYVPPSSAPRSKPSWRRRGSASRRGLRPVRRTSCTNGSWSRPSSAASTGKAWRRCDTTSGPYRPPTTRGWCRTKRSPTSSARGSVARRGSTPRRRSI